MAELGTAYVSIIPKVQGNFSGTMEKELGAAGTKSGKLFGANFSSSAKKLVKVGAAGVAAAGAVATAKTLDLVNSTAEYGDTVDKMSQKMGISSKAYQEWDAVLQHSGTSMDSMIPAFKKLSTQAQSGSDKTAAAFETIGISMEQAQSMSTEDLWNATIQGLQGMEEGTERTAVASQLLGRGATELGALLNTSSDDTQKMIDTVNELGGVMSEDAIKDAAAFQDALQDMQTSFTAIGRSVGAKVLPMFTEFMGGITQIVSGNPAEGFKQIGDALADVMPSGLVETLSSIGAALKENLGPAFESAKEMFGELGASINAFLQENAPAIGEMFGQAASLVSTAFGMIRQVITTAMPIIGTVVKTAIAGISAAFRTMNSIVGTVSGIFNRVKSAITNPINAAKSVVSSAINAVKGFLSGSFDFPHIKTPHFNISGGTIPWGIGGKGTAPRVDISYYAKGGIATGLSVIGEQGAEAIVPYTNSNIKPWANAMADAMGARGNTINLYAYGVNDPNQLINQIAGGLRQLNMMGA